MNHRKTTCLIVTLFLFLVTSTFQGLCQVKPSREIITDIEKLLNVISGYEYDKSRDWLQEFQDILHEVYKDPEAVKETEQLMIRFLQSNATMAGKQFICKYLGAIATKESIPVLSGMLADENTAEISLYVLEQIPDGAACEAMRNALPGTTKNTNVAIINSLGVCRDDKTVELLTKFIYENDPLISESAISALGAIGTLKSADILNTAINNLTGDLKWIATDAWLKCADRFVVENKLTDAQIIYNNVYAANSPLFLRKAALNGMFKTTQEDPVDFIIKHLQGDDPQIRPSVISLIYELSDDQNPGRIFNEIDSISQTDQLYLFTAIAYYGDCSMNQVIIDAINHDDPEVRMAGLKAIAKTGNASDILFLAEKASTLRGTERDLARESLYMLRGPEVDMAILSAVENAEPIIKVELIKSISERNITSAISMLLKFSEHADQNVRIESIEALGKIASPDDLPQIIQLLVNARSDRERKTAETAINMVTLKMPDGQHKSKDILSILPTVKDHATLNSFIAILGEIGDDRDFSILKEYLNSEDPEIQLAAIRALSMWPNATPKDDLKSIAETTKDLRKHTLALRGYIQIVEADKNLSEDQKFVEIRHAYDITTSLEEQKIVLSGLGKIISVQALKFATSLLEKSELASETEAAIMRIADELSWSHPGETREELNKVLQMTENEELIRDIEELLKRIEK